MPDMPRRTALYDRHVRLAGKMVKFAGFEMPVAYQKGIMSEAK
ncbi:glycine cleavage system aminomethyltransferase GcvT, partial [candidate division TA06 bacterium]